MNLEAMKHYQLVKHLDSEVSYYVRAGQAVRNGFPIIQCFTCGDPGYWKDMDAGHWISRRKFGTRFDLRNIRPQCKICNQNHDGKPETFAALLAAEDGGKETILDLLRINHQWGAKKLDREWLISEIKRYRRLNDGIKSIIREWQ